MSTYKSILVNACILLTAISISTTSCQKMDRPAMVIIPDDVAKLNGPLQKSLWFEGTGIDSIYYEKGTATNATFVQGINGKAYKGASNAMIVYSAGEKIPKLTSFTVSLWMNTQKHTGGAQIVFMLPRTSDFWGNMFLLIEGNGSATDNSMLIKYHFAGNWVEFTGGANPARLPDAYGKWKHLVFRYDETTSKFAAFVDGVKYALPANVEDRKKQPTPGNFVPLGPLELKDVSKFVIGAFQQHLGAPWGTPDGWMQRYTGLLDQFRLYTKPLTDAEITQLFTAKL